MSRRWVVVATLLALLLGAAALVGGSLGPGRRARFPSSFAAEPEGLLGIRLLLESVSVPVGVATEPWDRALADDPAGLVIVAAPLSRPPDAVEAQALRDWVERGGCVLIVDDATTLEAPDAFDELLERFGLETRRPTSDFDTATLKMSRPGRQPVRGTPAYPSDDSFTELVLSAAARITDRTRAIPLAIDTRGAIVAAEAEHGAGRVVLVLGALLANDRILLGDNLEFALRTIDELRGGGPILFDEYHHGYGGLLDTRRLDPAVIGWGLFQVVAVTLVFMLARGVRFGPPRLERSPQRRSSLEFVRSMAALYRRAEARKHVVRGAWHRFLRTARARWGLTETLPGPRLAGAVHRLGGLPLDEVTRIVDATRRTLDTDEEISESVMLARVRELARLEEESFR